MPKQTICLKCGSDSVGKVDITCAYCTQTRALKPCTNIRKKKGVEIKCKRFLCKEHNFVDDDVCLHCLSRTKLIELLAPPEEDSSSSEPASLGGGGGVVDGAVASVSEP